MEVVSWREIETAFKASSMAIHQIAIFRDSGKAENNSAKPEKRTMGSGSESWITAVD